MAKKLTVKELEAARKAINKDEEDEKKAKAKAAKTAAPVYTYKEAGSKVSPPAVGANAGTVTPPKAGDIGLLHPDLVRKYLGQGMAYAQQGPQSRQQIADALLGFDIGDHAKGVISSFSLDAMQEQSLRNRYFIGQHRQAGTFDSPEFLTEQYITMPSTAYLGKERDAALAALEESKKKDDADKLYQSNLQSTRGAWEQLEAEKNNPYMFDPMYGYAMMEYLQGDRSEPFNYDQWDYEYQNLSPADQQARLAGLKKQWDGLDFDALTGRNYKYESQTPGLQAQYDLISGQLANREKAEELETFVRSQPDFPEKSQYVDSYTAPEKGSLAYIFSNDAFVQGLDDPLRFIHSDANWATRELAGEYSGKAKYYFEHGYHLMAPEQRYTYTYLYESGMKKEAAEYLAAIQPELNKAMSDIITEYYTTRDETVPGAIIDSLWSVPGKIKGTLDTGAGILMGKTDPNDPLYRTAQNVDTIRGVSGQTAGELLPVEIFGQKAGTFLYGLGMSTLDMIAAQQMAGVLVTATGKADTMKNIMGAIMATEAGTDTFRGDLESGMGFEYALGHGIANGLVNRWAESGFLDNLFSENGKFLTKVLKSGGSEGLEEVFESGMNLGTDAFVSYLTGKQSEIEQAYNYYVATVGKDKAAAATMQHFANQFASDGLAGFIMGGTTSAVYNTTEHIGNRSTGKALTKDGDPDRMLGIAKSMPEGSEARRIAEDIEGKVSGGKEMSLGDLGRMTNALAGELREDYGSTVKQVMNDAIAKRLVEVGSTPEKARSNADAIRKIANGENITLKERAGLMWDDAASQVTRELTTEDSDITGSNAGEKNNQNWLSDMRSDIGKKGNDTLAKMADAQAAANTKNVSTTVKEAVKRGADKVEAGKNGQPAAKETDRNITYVDGGVTGSGRLARFEEVDGELTMAVSTGKGKDGKDTTVNVPLDSLNKASGKGTAGLIEAVKDINETLHPVSAEEASTMLATYELTGGDVGAFVENYERAYLSGYSGANNVSVAIDPKLAQMARESGQRQAEKDEKTRLDRVARARKVQTPSVGWIGDVSDNSQIRGRGDTASLDEAVEGMTDGQRYVVEYGKALAEKAHINVVFFNSKADPSGKFTADNGRYDPNTHTIYLDINAGLNDSKAIKAAKKKGALGYAMMRTLGHEVTHAIESTSAEYYAKYKQAVKNALKAKGQDWAMLVRGRIDEAVADGKKMTYAEAESEIVADASEYMLQDADFSKGLDAGIVNKIKAVVKNFVTKLNDIFRELGKSGSIESFTLREMQDGVYHYMGGLQELWGAAFEESQATVTNGGVDDALYETGEIYSYTAQSSARVRDKKTIADLENQQHITTYRAMQVIDGELYPPMAEFIGSKKGGNREDPGVIGQWEMAVEHPELIKWVNGKPKFELKKTNDDGSVSTVPAAYNPYMHSSNTVLNDQFSKAFQRTNLVVVECVVPVSESDGAYHAQYAKDATGWHEWKSGVVAGDLAKQKSGFRRDVFLSRYIKPVRILPDSEVAEKIAGYLEGTDVTVPFQSAWPTLREALVQAGVNVTEPRGLGPAQMKIAMEAFDEWQHEYKVHSASRKRDYVHHFPEVRDAFTDGEYHAFSESINKKIRRNPKKRYFVEPVTYHKDITKVGFVRKVGAGKYEVYDLYKLNTELYNGRIIDLINILEGAVSEYGHEKFAEWLRSPAYDVLTAFFSRYDRQSYEFPEFDDYDRSSEAASDAVRRIGSRWQRGAVSPASEPVTSSDGIEIDSDDNSAYMQSSARTWRGSDYVTKREEMAQKLVNSLDVSIVTARKWIDDVSSIAAYVLDNKARVDYIPTAVQGVSAFKSNPEYGGSIDMSTICAKRRLATGTLDAIQRVLGDAVLTKDDFLHIREMMKERGYEVACGLCFVESSRKNLSKYNAQFMEQYNRTHPDGDISMTDLNTVDGLEALRLNNEDAYTEYEKFMNKLARRKPKLFEKRTEYNHEILKKFKSDTTVDIKNLNGGLRLQSFSDFEIVHLIDMMQVITDMASVGLAGQAYTKVPDFAWALGDTGLKINLSLIAKGVDADGNLIFDDVEGMNHNEAKKLRDAYSKNVGTIVVTFTDEQLLAAMKSDMVDYIIPFHRSQWQKGDYKKLGLPEGTKDYTLHQNEKQGRKRVKENFLPNAYWDFSLSGKENAEKYLSLCAASGRTPKFAKFLVNNGDGTYSLQPDGSTDGYWKLLIDFKMYDNRGNGSPKLPVQPNFNMNEAMRMLEGYKGEHDSFPVAQDVVDDFVKEYRGDKGGVQMVDGRYTLAPVQSSARRNTPDELTTRDYLAESDDSIAETVEERNALTVYQKLLKNHAAASEAVMAAEQALETAPESQKDEARKTLSAARAKQRDLYNRLLNVERTAHVQSVISRTNQFMTEELQGKTRAAVEKAIADREAKIAELKADLTGLKGAAKTQREADIRQHERIVARFKSKAAQMVLENSEKYQRQIADIRLRRDVNIEIGKKTRHIKKVVKALNDRIVHEEDYKNVKEPLKPAVHTLVRTFLDGFGNLVFDQKTADKLKSVYDVLAQDDATVEYYDDEVSDWLTTLANISRQDEERRAGGATLESLNDKLYTYTTLADIADHVAHMVTAADTMFMEGRKASVSGVTEDIGNTLLAKKDRPELAGSLGKAANFVDNLIIRGNMMPQFFFEGLNNKGMMQLYDGLQDGVRMYSERLLTGENFLEDAMRRYGYRTWRDMDKVVEFKTQQGHTIHLKRENMMWLYATAKREASNPLMDTHHLDEGGFVYEESSAPTKGLFKAKNHQQHHKIVQEDVEAITAMLTPEQIAFMDECVEFLSTECADWGNEASMQLFGIKKYKEKYYFPFKVDGGQLYKNSAAGSTSTTSDARVKHISFSHSIKKGANTPLVMGEFTSVIADHINQMATYSGLVVPIENMNRVLNRKVDDDGDMVTIRSLLGRKHGSPSSKYVDDLLKDLNGGPQTDNRGTWDAGIRLFKKNAVVGKMSVAIQQPTAITRAFAYINPRWFANLHMERPKETWERMMKYSGTAVLKDMGGFNVGLGQGAKNWIERGDLGDYNVFKRSKFLLDQKGFKAAKDEWVDFLTGLPGWMDKVTWISIWNAVENEQTHQHPNMDRNSDEFLQMVGRRFDGIVNHTQVYDSILSKSQNMRSKNTLAKMATSFMAESTLNMNLAYRAFASRDVKQIGKVVSSLLLNAALGAAAYALVGAWNKDDDDRTWEEKYAVAFAGRLADNLNPMASIPYLSDIWNKIQGYDVERTDLSYVLDLAEDCMKFFDKMFNPDEALSYRDYENFVGGMFAAATGIPAKNWMGDARRIWNMTHTKTEDAPSSRVWYGILDEILPGRGANNTAYYERLLAATMDGDKQEMYDLKDYLMATKGVKESSITSGVRDAYKKVYLRGGVTKNEAVSFLLANGLVSGKTEAERKQNAFEYVDKWDEGTDGYSAYNTLRKAFSDGNSASIQKAWDELEANGWSDDSIGSYVRNTIIKEMVTSGKITPAKATELIRKWYPYKKDKDNVNKPKEWLNSK